MSPATNDPDLQPSKRAKAKVPAAANTPAHTGHDHTLSPRTRSPKRGPGRLYNTHPSRDGLNVFLMRHASAGTRRLNPKLDVKRPLDKEGKQLCLQLAQVL